jgi:hypothetical protein
VERKGATIFQDGKSSTPYTTLPPIKCRKSSLNYKDLQYLDRIKETSVGTAKLWTLPDADVQLGDRIIIEEKCYEIFSVSDCEGTNEQEQINHHKKLYIKIIE